jgi:hypothetical protein
MAVPISHSEGTYVVLKENRGATLWRRVSNDAVVSPDTWDVTPFFVLDPRGPTPIEVVCTLQAEDLRPTDGLPSHFEFSLEVPTDGRRLEYQCGWIDTAGNREVAFYGEIVST